MYFHLLFIATLVAFATSEAPRFNSRFQFQRNEQAPYPPAGYRPAGEEFRLPVRQQLPPSSYGSPQEYGPPKEYGPPEVTTESFEDDAVTTTTELPTSTTFTPARSQLKEKPEKIQNEEVLDQGVYYIYHPNGFLQRVTYETRNDIRNMGYIAQLSYKDVEPIREPIYTYDPQTLVFQQIKL